MTAGVEGKRRRTGMAYALKVGLYRCGEFLRLPKDLYGYRLTWKRLLNLYRTRLAMGRLECVLRSRPTRLVIEPTNICNLHCPYCHTGAGRFGRRPGMLRLDIYNKVLAEIGDYLMMIEVFNWGESLLNPQLPEIIRAASRRGISTRVNTNMSLPLTRARAEDLVDSGLTDFFVAIDGATQEIYQRYRVGGDLEVVKANCRLINDVKRQRRTRLPKMTLQSLEFPFNRQHQLPILALAAELGMETFSIRAAVPDPDWPRQPAERPWFMVHAPFPCHFLWDQPVLTVDGNIAPCRGVFQSFDDVVHIAATPEESGAHSFAEAWNHPTYQRARALFRERRGDNGDDLVCRDCPTTVYWERWRMHHQRGGSTETFAPGMEPSANAAWNYFWKRGQRGAERAVSEAPAGIAGVVHRSTDDARGGPRISA